MHAAGTTIALEGATHREALGRENARPFQFGSSPDQSALGSGPSASNGGVSRKRLESSSCLLALSRFRGHFHGFERLATRDGNN